MPADEPRSADEHGWEVHEASADALRGAMRPSPTGVTVVTSGREERAEGMTANAVVSVSLDPPPLPGDVHKDARLNPRIREEGYFAANILAAEQEGLSRLFASPERSRRAAGDPVSRRRLRLYRRPARDGGARDHRVRARGGPPRRRPRPLRRAGRSRQDGRHSAGNL